jgi:hypothetical protein
MHREIQCINPQNYLRLGFEMNLLCSERFHCLQSKIIRVSVKDNISTLALYKDTGY